MRGSVPLLALLAVLGAAAPAAAATPAPAQLARGERLVRIHCSGCHAVALKGASPNHAAPPFRELHTRYNIDDLAEGLAEGLLTGHPAMPEFMFSPDDVQAIIAYLKSIQTHQEAGLPTATGR